MAEAADIDIADLTNAQIKRTLFVTGLDDHQVNVERLYRLFETFGEIRSVDIPLDKHTNSIRGFAFVEFADVADAKEAQQNMDGADLYGRTLNVKFAKVLASNDQNTR